jgi:hypothetical protein
MATPDDYLEDDEESWGRFRAAYPVFQSIVEILRDLARELEMRGVNPTVTPIVPDTPIDETRPRHLVELLDHMANKSEGLIDILLHNGEFE